MDVRIFINSFGEVEQHFLHTYSFGILSDIMAIFKGLTFLLIIFDIQYKLYQFFFIEFEIAP